MELIKVGQQLKIDKFIRVPHNVVGLLKYKDLKLKSVDVLAYSIMLNRLNLSVNKPQEFSKNGVLYIVYEQKELAADLGLSNRGVINTLQRLEEVGLISVERQGKMSPNLYMFYDIFDLSAESLYAKLSPVCKNVTHEVQNSHCIKTDSIKTDINNNTQDTNKTDITDKKTKTYTTLSSGGFFLKHYGEKFKSYFKTDHREISQEDLITLSNTIEDITHELNIDRVLYTTLVDYHFKHLSTKNNGHIKAFVGRKNDSPLYRYINELV